MPKQQLVVSQSATHYISILQAAAVVAIFFFSNLSSRSRYNAPAFLSVSLSQTRTHTGCVLSVKHARLTSHPNHMRQHYALTVQPLLPFCFTTPLLSLPHGTLHILLGVLTR